ncbi:DUF5694 domain-containing protein [Aestuariibacter halophilus]|uniref:DUF5694 domain-containing protein n=1 Tax=Fluctibacter halophilus TaxID=226011 RepID=A0ABS8G346_9ALTE|nr:DUF5694 domain-containing protein [Aestuariibacter halophilus]MCC2615002.1 DUF5694 domain-containing protein [Aestuariibacter halophilus]
MFDRTQLQRLLPMLLMLATVSVSAIADVPPAKVMMMGTFHFDSPGKDTIKVTHLDVMTANNQAYLEGFSTRVAQQFAPTHVLLECSPENQSLIEQRLADYLAGNDPLRRNEIYQVGFRIAAQSEGAKVMCFDHRDVPWQAEPLFAAMTSQPSLDASMQALLDSHKARMDALHARGDLRAILLDSNDPDIDRQNQYLYLHTNAVGAFDDFIGADAAASWWHRNFRMYANVQQVAAPGTRVFVLGGQGHTAILKDLLAIDTAREAIDVLPYLH